MTEKDIWPGKKKNGGRKLLNSVFEKTLMIYQRKGCAALNHKSFSRLCQISSTLQALKRNKETLLFGFPYSEGDRKLKGAQINLKMRTKYGVLPSYQAAAPGGTRERSHSPSAWRSYSRPLRARTQHDHRAIQRKPNSATEAGASRHRRGPTEKGSARCSFPGSCPLIRGFLGRSGPAGEVQPATPSLLGCSETGEAQRGKRHLNPQAAGGARLGQTRRRSDPGAPRPPARRSHKRSSRQVALKCIPLPLNRRGGEG